MKLIHGLFRFANMKTILAVIFLGILTFAFAAQPILQECKNYKAMENFDSSRFLTGTWHVTNAEHGSNSTVCREYKIETKSGIQELTADGYYRHGQNLKVYFEVRCKKLSDNKGKFTFNCTQKGLSNSINFQYELEVTVLFTDYSDLAIMYRCVKRPPQHGSRIEDNFLVLHRDASKTDDKNRQIEDTLKKQGLSLNTFISRKGVNCIQPPQKRNT